MLVIRELLVEVCSNYASALLHKSLHTLIFDLG